LQPEEKVSKADVEALVAQAMASVKSEKKSKEDAKDGETEAVQEKTSFVEGKDALQAAMKAVKEAVAADGAGKLGLAAKKYDSALDQFGVALKNGVPTSEDSRKKLVESMSGYLDRIQAILKSFGPQPDPKEVISCETVIPYTEVNGRRLETLKAMNKAGFSCVTRGVTLRKEGMEEEEKNNVWVAFLLYSEAIDCFVAYMKADVKGAQNKTVEKTVLELLDVAEKLKKEM